MRFCVCAEAAPSCPRMLMADYQAGGNSQCFRQFCFLSGKPGNSFLTVLSGASWGQALGLHSLQLALQRNVCYPSYKGEA